jgi:hypothetical protein
MMLMFILSGVFFSAANFPDAMQPSSERCRSSP